MRCDAKMQGVKFMRSDAETLDVKLVYHVGR
jgi:hypothetical protein